MPFKLLPIVEGLGEEWSLPLLLRRLLVEKLGYTDADVEILHPKNTRGCGRMTADDGIERYVQHALKEACDGVLILIDNDAAIALHKQKYLQDDCAPALAHYLARRVAALYRSKPVAIVVARWEYEAWFLASLETVGPALGVPEGYSFVEDVETVRGVKEWFNTHLPDNRRYTVTLDQPSMTGYLDLDLVARRSRSFRRLEHALQQLIDAYLKNAIVVTPVGEPCQQDAGDPNL